MTPARIIILIGPNGAGKSTVGQIAADCFGWRYLSLEEFFRSLYPTFADYQANRLAAYHTFDAEVRAASNALETTLIFEEVGMSDLAQALIAGLQRDYTVRLVEVIASADTCLRRVAARSLERNFPKTLEGVAEVHRRFFVEVEPRYRFDLVLENEQMTADEICRRLEPLAKRG